MKSFISNKYIFKSEDGWYERKFSAKSLKDIVFANIYCKGLSMDGIPRVLEREFKEYEKNVNTFVWIPISGIPDNNNTIMMSVELTTFGFLKHHVNCEWFGRGIMEYTLRTFDCCELRRVGITHDFDCFYELEMDRRKAKIIKEEIYRSNKRQKYNFED